MIELKRSLATFAVVAAGTLAVAAPAGAQAPNGFAAQQPEAGIIAILIGLVQKPFTPPLGSDKGS